MGYSIDPISDNCYPDTTVLINKLDIRDEETLNEAETLATYINASKLEEHPLEGVFDFVHYKTVHHLVLDRHRSPHDCLNPCVEWHDKSPEASVK